MTKVVDLVKDDVSAFLKSNQELLFNERDLQMHLALWLKAGQRRSSVDGLTKIFG